MAAVEDVLEGYHRPHDANRPLVCIDEASRQLIGEAVGLAARAGDSALRRDVAAWERDRNAEAVRVDWQFTTADARVKR